MAEAKQATTIVAHRALAVRDLAVEMWTSPWIVELSRNSRICEITIMFFPFRFRFVLFFNGNDFTLPSQFQIVTWLTEGCFKSVCWQWSLQQEQGLAMVEAKVFVPKKREWTNKV